MRDLREKTGARAGHAGTLDPFATGLLLVLLGSFTKQAQRFVGLSKRYETTVDLSRLTSTGDPEGDVIEKHDPPSESELAGLLEALRGEVDLKIPAASAVKIGGERAYKLHRKGVAVEMPTRKTTVSSSSSSTTRRRSRASPCDSARAATSGRWPRRSAATA